MLRKHPFLASNYIERFLINFTEFSRFLSSFISKKIVTWSASFEKYKNILVKLFMVKRGRYSRPFLHIATLSVIALGILLSPLFASTYPIFSQGSEQSNTIGPSQKQSISLSDDVFQTGISQKPRDETIIYKVQRGDSLSTIAKKFGISVETIKWENDLTGDNLSVGDELHILSVTGIAHKVSPGDTIYSIAKKYDAEPQAIADFTFNEFADPETFSLVAGQILIVPEGIKPSEQPFIKRQVFIAQGPSGPVSSSGFTWPLRGPISQFAAWYHMAIDVEGPVGTPVVAANSGTVSGVVTGSYDGGYGTNLYIDGGNGYVTHYAHLSGVNVSTGQSVTAGQTVIGWVGLTGRTTGSHLHFEILRNGVLVNPLAFLQ